MPSEIRRLVFENSELAEAMDRYGQQFDIHFPKGKVIKAKFAREGMDLHTQQEKAMDFSRQYNVQGNDSSVLVTFFDEVSFEHKLFSMTNEFVSGALIQYCLEHDIPMPMRGKKKLDITEFNVCLDIVITSEEVSNLELDD